MPIGAIVSAIPCDVEMPAVLHHGNCAVAGANIFGDALWPCLYQIGVHERGQIESFLPIRHIVCNAVHDDIRRISRNVAVHCQPVAGARIYAVIVGTEEVCRRCTGTGWCWQAAGNVTVVATAIGRRIVPGSAVADAIVELEVGGASGVRCSWTIHCLDKICCRITRSLGARAWGELGGAGYCHVERSAKCSRHASDDRISVVWSCLTGARAFARNGDEGAIVEPFGEIGRRDIGEQPLESICGPVVATASRVRRRAWIRTDRRARVNRCDKIQYDRQHETDDQQILQLLRAHGEPPLYKTSDETKKATVRAEMARTPLKRFSFLN